ncbi:ogr/Delta-like zinc finger family protein [Chelonobacter oris]|uniref:ogr/Delta-like zinc finger family protein n=1 Tax=Chelonobacter oris TaxID=505317 RepID=UPI003CC6502F
MSRVLQVKCRVCEHRAMITKAARVHNDFLRLYCRCTNPECNHKFVMNLEYSHTTHTSYLDRNSLLIELVSRLSDSDKDVLRNAISK